MKITLEEEKRKKMINFLARHNIVHTIDGDTIIFEKDNTITIESVRKGCILRFPNENTYRIGIHRNVRIQKDNKVIYEVE